MGRAFDATSRVTRGLFSMRTAMVASAGAAGMGFLLRRTGEGFMAALGGGATAGAVPERHKEAAP